MESDFERSLTIAEIALGQIKSLHLPASPHNFEFWYSYASGYHLRFNEAVNEILKAGSITQFEIDRIYDLHLCPLRNTQRLDAVGARVVDEIDQVMSMIDAAVGTASRHSENLEQVSTRLGSSTVDRESLRTIVTALISSTKEMEQVNRGLEDSLRSSKQEITQLQKNLAAIRTESLTDPLTGLANRKSFDEGLASEITAAEKSGHPLSLLMIDIDHFKRFNDTHGHLTGDQVLRLVAMSLQQNIKGQDFAARYGGEEFAVVLPKTSLRQATSVADQLRRIVMTRELVKRTTGEKLGRITISAGVGQWHPGDPPQGLIERADTCLYAAKHNGRNCVICETDPEVVSPATTSKVA